MTTATTQPHWWVGIIDDDASLRRAIARFLREHAISIELFASAEEYLNRVVGGEPCCLIVDVHLGGLTGFELQDYLLSRDMAPPIIFITGHEEITSAQLAARAGACGFLRKPFEGRALLTLLHEHLPRAALEQYSR